MPTNDDGVDPTLEISETGEIVGGSRAARRRLAAAAGTWRVAPSPPGLLLLARVDDGHARAPAARVALAGEITGPGVLADVINFVHFNQWDGTLSVISDAIRRSLSFAKGQLLGVASNLPEDRLGAMLVRFGHVTTEQLAECVRDVTPQKRLGSILVERGYMSSTDLFEGVRRQAEEIFYAVLLQRRGAFYVTRDGESQAAVRLHLDTQALLLEGLRRIDEMAYFRDKLPGPEVVLVRRGAPPDTLSGDALTVYRLIDGRRSLADIGRDSKLGEFGATKAAFELLQRGVAHVRSSTTLPRRHRDSIPPDATAAMIDAYNIAFARIHAACGAAGKPSAVREGVAAFISGTARFAALLEGVVAGDDGTLPAAKLVQNCRALDKDGVELLGAALQELVVFVLFLAEGALDRSAEQTIHEHLARTLANLRPAEL